MSKPIVFALMAAFLAAPPLAPPIAHAQTPTPPSTVQGYQGSGDLAPYQGDFAALAIEIDAFWSETFPDAGVVYESPDIFPVEQLTFTACGPIEPIPNAFYCPDDRTIYLVPQFLSDQADQFGDFAPIAVLSHEWGHHVQALLRVVGPTRKAFELQADCLMGAFTRHADERALLDYGDFMEVLDSAIDAGDDTPLPEDAPGAHGLPEERVKALTKGFGGGAVTGCNLPLPPSPTPSPNPPLVTETPTPTPIPELEIDEELLRRLPNVLPLDPASCFGIVDDGTLSFDQLLGRFSGVEDAATRLETWGWQASAFRQFGCEAPPEGEAGWIDISVHLFGDSFSAREAVDYFAAVRADGGPLFHVESPDIGDHAAALSGPASNGKEFTIYASQGPLLVRVTGVASSGIPFIDVLTVTRAVLEAQQAQQPQPLLTPTPTVQVDSGPASAYLPTSPAVRHRDCFEVLSDGPHAYGEVASALQEWGLTQAEIDAFGWQDGAYRGFTCADPPSGRATQIDVVIHRFRDAQTARQVAPYFAGTYGFGENQARSCDTAGPLVICITGRSLTGSPLSDVHFVLQDVLSAARQ